MNLAVDAVNTFTKVGIFEKDSLKKKEVFETSPELRIFLQRTIVEHLIIGSVTLQGEEVASWSATSGLKLILQPTLPLPIRNRYVTPETLGADRMAAASGAWSLFPRQDSMVIDVGTCINYEFVNWHGEYEGGAISPGVKMRFQVMQHFTAKLPMANAIETDPLTGDTTASCLQSGVMNGVLHEIKGAMARYDRNHPDIRVILTGGDAHFFENHLKPSIFVAPDLVLMVLNSILLHNVTS